MSAPKYRYITVNGREAEAAFAQTSAPNAPVATGADGKIHSSFFPTIGKATSLVVTRTADEDIGLGELVYSVGDFKVALADSQDTKERATVLGIATSSVLEGQEVDILVLGVLEDSAFEIFAVNALLFLDEDGAITDERPSSPTYNYLTSIGKSLGEGEILVSIETPIAL